MSHLVEYENAQGEKAKALAALEVVKMKNSKRLAWNWANTAISHAYIAGINNPSDMVGNGRWPETKALEDALKAL